MKINLKNTVQCQAPAAKAFERLYNKASEWSTNHTNTMRLVGPILIMGATLISLVVSVASVAETIIKGIANIFGSPFFKDDSSFSRGCKMLTLNLLGDGLRLAYCCLKVAHLPIEMLETAIDPHRMLSSNSTEARKE